MDEIFFLQTFAEKKVTVRSLVFLQWMITGSGCPIDASLTGHMTAHRHIGSKSFQLWFDLLQWRRNMNSESMPVPMITLPARVLCQFSIIIGTLVLIEDNRKPVYISLQGSKAAL